jgi:transcriptional regulator with XRE-family HTH domain
MEVAHMRQHVLVNVVIELKANNLSQRWLAEKARIHESQLSQIINGKLLPSDRQRQAIAKALKMQLEQLFS